ncbi:hypothetical protein [Lentilactobacillus kosonis]|uniref:hypothetical protein n=1 Tax=Lentilactobacillus kosonis TaxID=2810561 RepID=UPI00135C7F1C|nr:hypothetical protein [Lentilactobacillus kosonis]
MNKPISNSTPALASLFLAFIVVAANSNDRPLFKAVAFMLIVLMLILAFKIFHKRK